MAEKTVQEKFDDVLSGVARNMPEGVELLNASRADVERDIQGLCLMFYKAGVLECRLLQTKKLKADYEAVYGKPNA